ncbi:MAG: adenosine kinase, partial [Acidimicrobiia bacterium]|nr:adenosine kinase [Acidimicrobiia bacterium]
MTTFDVPRLDVLGIGNALVDVFAHHDEAFLAEHGMRKGTMALIDADVALRLHDDLAPVSQVAGGSAANTLAGLASLGGRGGFLGRVAGDELGRLYVSDITALGVQFPVAPATAGQPTGRCLIVLTPDAERTMNTYLGAAAEIGPDDVDEEVVAAASVVYLEAFLFSPPPALGALTKAAEVCRRGSGKLALSLSDPSNVERHGDALRAMLEDGVDLLFGNEDELRLLYGGTGEEALAAAEARCPLVAMTRGPEGCVVAAGGERVAVPAVSVASVVDTTGAGDLFAAGFLYGVT